MHIYIFVRFNTIVVLELKYNMKENEKNINKFKSI